MPLKNDNRDTYRVEYNTMLVDKATGANGIMQEKYITVTVSKKDVEEARAFFARVGAELTTHFADLSAKCYELDTEERLRIQENSVRRSGLLRYNSYNVSLHSCTIPMG